MPKTYEIRTYGCQMNVHDSERLAGLLEDAGYARAGDEQADLVVFNTCAVRENADNRLYGNLTHLVPAKKARPDMQIAVGGCLAQKDRGRIVEKAPWVDVVFGTHNLAALPVLLERARHNRDAQVEIVEALQNFPSDLPSRRESPSARGCRSRSAATTPARSASSRPCAAPRPTAGPATYWPRSARWSRPASLEVTLLGQNVNSYGRSFGDRFAFGKLLRACGEIDGLERVRFTSPHPRDFTDDVIAAMAETPNVMPQLHMPMQSGSDAVLRAMRRSYRQERYLAHHRQRAGRDARCGDHHRHHRRLPRRDRGRLRADAGRRAARPVRQRVHLPVLEAARHAGGDDGRPDAQGGRAGALRAADRAAGRDLLGRRQGAVGREVEVLVSTGEGRKDGATGRVSGRARDGRLVHVAGTAEPGDLVTATVTYAAPHHLVADAGITAHRPWRGGRRHSHAARRSNC